MSLPGVSRVGSTALTWELKRGLGHLALCLQFVVGAGVWQQQAFNVCALIQAEWQMGKDSKGDEFCCLLQIVRRETGNRWCWTTGNTAEENTVGR